MKQIPVNQYDMDTLQFVKRYDDIKEAAKALCLRPVQIKDVCDELKHRYTAGGYAWSYDYKKPRKKMKQKSTRAIPVVQLTLDNKYIATYPSLTKAGSSFGNNGSYIANACAYGINAYGYKWMHKNEYDERVKAGWI